MNKPPRKKYVDQKANAKRRKIPFQLTFDQWWEIWSSSGKWNKRGRKKGQYCMARKDDCGSYSLGNVFIAPTSQNAGEIKPYTRDAKWRQRLSRQMRGNKNMLGRKHTKQTKKKMSRSLKGRVPGFGGKRHSSVTKKWMQTHWKNQHSEGNGL